MAEKRIQDLEQTTDLTNDDLIPLDTSRKTFATTLKSLVEWLKNTFQTKDNLEQALSDATDKYPSSKTLKDESSRIVSIMDNQYSNLLKTLYPVGSIYIGTQNSCPLATLIAGSQWQRVATQVVTNVNTGVAVYGNGQALMITDGTHHSYMQSYDAYNAVAVKVSKQDYGNSIQNAGATLSMDKPSSIITGAIGVIKDASKSGLTGSVTRSNLALNIWERTA